MSGNPLRLIGIAARTCALVGALTFLTGCGFKLAGPGETLSIQPLATDDLAGACVFEMNMPDQPLASIGVLPDPKIPRPTETAALVIYERGDSASLFNDPQIQEMATKLHMVTVFAHQCNSKTYGDLQADASKGPGRALFQALTQYATDSMHPEIGGLKVVLSGFSAAGVLAMTMEDNYPDRVLTAIPYASGNPWFNLDELKVTPAMARIPTLILANAYDSQSGNQKSLRLFKRGLAQGAVWGFGVQNHTDHCCTVSTRDLMVPWVTALTPVIPEPITPTAPSAAVSYNSFAVPAAPTVSFSTFTDGWPDAQGEVDIWIPLAATSPTSGGPLQGWVPDGATAQAWYKWVTSLGTN